MGSGGYSAGEPAHIADHVGYTDQANAGSATPRIACGSGYGAACSSRAREQSGGGVRRNANQLEPERALFEELLASFREGVRRDLREDLREVSTQLKASWAAEVGQQLQRELVSVTTELKSEVKLDAAALRSQLAHVSDQLGGQVKAHASGQAKTIEANVAPVLEDIQKLRSRVDLDLSSILEAVGRAEKEVEDLKKRLATEAKQPPRVLESAAESELHSTLQEVRELRRAFPQVQVDLAGVLSTVRAIAADVDQAPMLRELSHIRQQGVQADLSPLLEELRELRMQVLQGEHDARSPRTVVPEVDFLGLQQEIRSIGQQMAQADLSPVIQEIGRMQQQMQQALSQSVPRAETDLSPVIAAVERSAAKADLAPLMQELQVVKALCQNPPRLAGADLSPVLAALGRLESQTASPAQAPVEPVLLGLRQELDAVKALCQNPPRPAGVDLSPVLAALGRVEAKVAAAPPPPPVEPVIPVLRQELDVVKALFRDQLHAEVDMSPVIAAVEALGSKVELAPITQDLVAIKALCGNLPQPAAADLSPVLAAIERVGSKVPSAPPAALAPPLKQELDAIKALCQHPPQPAVVDLAPVLAAVGRVEAAVASAAGARAEPVLPALRQELEAVKAACARPPAAAPDLAPVLKAVECVAAKVERFDLAPVLKELESLRQRPEPPAVDLSPVIGAVSELKKQVGVLPSESDLRQLRAQFEAEISSLSKVVHEWQTDLRLSMADQKSKGPEVPLVSQDVSSEKREIELGVVLRAIEEARTRPDLGHVVGAVQEAVRELRASAEARESRASEDIGKVLAAIQETQSTLLSRTAVDLAPVIRAIGESRPQVDLTPVLQAIRESRAPSDLTPVLRAIEESRAPPVDLAPVLRAVSESRPQVDLSPVLRAIDESRREVDLSPVLRAIGESRTAVDLTPVLRAIEESRAPPLDLAPVFRAISECRPQVDFSPVLEAINQSKTQVDFSPVLRAIGESRPQVDFSPVLEAIRQGAAQMDFSPVLRAIKESRSQVDFSPVFRAIAESRPLVDMAQVLCAIGESKPQVDVSPVLDAIAGIRPQVDLAPVLSAINEIRHVDLAPVLHALSEGGPQVDLSPVLRAISESRPQVDLSPVLRAIGESRPQVDLSPVLRAISDIKTGVDLSPVLGAISETREGITAPILHAIQGLAPAILANKEGRVPPVDLAPVLRAIGESRAAVDLSPVLCAIDESRGALSQAFRAASEATVQVDLSPVLQAISELKAQMPQVNLTPVLQELHGIRRQAPPGEAALASQLKSLGEAVRDLRASTDVSRVLEVVQENRNLLLNRITEERAVSDFKAAQVVPTVDLSPVLQELRDLKQQSLKAALHTDLMQAVTDTRAELLKAVRDARLQSESLPSLQQEVRELRQQQLLAQDDLSSILVSVRKGTTEAVAGPLLAELRSLHQGLQDIAQHHQPQPEPQLTSVVGAVQESVAELWREMRQLGPQGRADHIELLRAVRESRLQPDPAMLLELKEVKQGQAAARDNDALVLAAIKESRAQVELLLLRSSEEPRGPGTSCPPELVKELRELRQRAGADQEALQGGVQELRKQVALLPSQTELATLRALCEAEFACLKKASVGVRAEADLSFLLGEVRDLKQQRAQADLTPLLVELKNLWREIPEGEAKLASMLKTVGEGLAEMRQEQRQAEDRAVSPAVSTAALEKLRSEIESLQRGVKELQAPRRASEAETRLLADVSQLMRDLREPMRDLRDWRQQQQPKQQAVRTQEEQPVNGDLIRSLTAIRDSVSDVWQVLREVQQSGTEVLKTVKEPRPDVESSAELLREVRELKQHQLLLRGDIAVVPGLKERRASEASPVEAALQPVLFGMREDLAALRGEVAVLQRFGPQAEAWLQELLKAVRGCGSNSAPSPSLEAVTECLAALRADLQQLIPQGKAEFAEVLKAVRETRSTSAPSPSLEAVTECLTALRSDLQQVIPQGKAEFAEVLKAVRETRPDSSMADALGALQRGMLELAKQSAELIPGVKTALADLLQPYHELRPDLPVSKALSELRDHLLEVRKAAQQIDADSPISKGVSELREHVLEVRQALQRFPQTKAELSEILQSIVQPGLPEATVNLIVEGLGDMRQHQVLAREAIGTLRRESGEVKENLLVSLSTIQELIKELRPQADKHLSELLAAVRSAECKAQLDAVVAEVRKVKPPEVDLSPVLTAIKGSRTPEVDLSPVLKAIRDMRAEIDIPDLTIQVKQLQNRLDLGPILKAVRDIDLGPVLKAVREVDLGQLSAAVQKLPSQVADLVKAQSAPSKEPKDELSALAVRLSEITPLVQQLPEQVKAGVTPHLEDFSRLSQKLLALVDVNHQEVLAQIQRHGRTLESTMPSSQQGMFHGTNLSHEEPPRGSGGWKLVKIGSAEACGLPMRSAMGSLNNVIPGPQLRSDPLRAPLGSAIGILPVQDHAVAVDLGELDQRPGA